MTGLKVADSFWVSFWVRVEEGVGLSLNNNNLIAKDWYCGNIGFGFSFSGGS